MMTSFEPEALGNLVEGMDFHRFYFENGHFTFAAHFHKIVKNGCEALKSFRLDVCQEDG